MSFDTNKFGKMPEQRHKELSAKGGRNSGTARRRKRSLKEAADLYLSLPVKDKRAVKALTRNGLEDDDIDNQMAVIAGLAKQAAAGDARAAKVLFDVLGDSVMGAGAEESNLMGAIAASTQGEVDTSDIPELQQETTACPDMVEPSTPEKS